MKRVVLAGLLISALGFSTVSTFAQEGSIATGAGFRHPDQKGCWRTDSRWPQAPTRYA